MKHIYRSLLTIAALTAALLATSNSATAALLHIVIAPITLTGVGACTGPDLSPTAGDSLNTTPVPNFSGNCWDVDNFPVNPGFDQIILTGNTYDLTDPTFPLSAGSLSWTFVPGDTGGGSAGPEDPDCVGTGVDNAITLDRAITINDVFSGTLHQSGNLRVGWCYDTLTIGLGTGTVLGVTDFGDVTVTVQGVEVQASLDPDGELEVGVNATAIAVPLPSTLALLGLGFAGFGFRRRPRA